MTRILFSLAGGRATPPHTMTAAGHKNLDADQQGFYEELMSARQLPSTQIDTFVLPGF